MSSPHCNFRSVVVAGKVLERYFKTSNENCVYWLYLIHKNINSCEEKNSKRSNGEKVVSQPIHGSELKISGTRPSNNTLPHSCTSSTHQDTLFPNR